jgi:hypothetical protein
MPKVFPVSVSAEGFPVRERFGATPKGTIDLFRNLKAIEIFCVNTFKVEINESVKSSYK